MQPPTRRDFLRHSAGACLATGLWPGRLRAADNGKGGTFTFIAVNDLHFHDAACAPWFERVFAQMKASAPDAAFYLLGGDLADEGTPEQLDGIRASLTHLTVPYYAVMGNHDHTPSADKSSTDRKAYEQMFPGRLNYRFDHLDWQFLGLDTTQGDGWKDTVISDDTLRFVDATLKTMDPARPTVLFTHFPLGEGVKYRPVNADALLERFRDVNVAAGFSGHWHGYTEKAWNRGVLTTDACCARVQKNHDGTTAKGWFVCEARDGKITRRFVTLEE